MGTSRFGKFIQNKAAQLAKSSPGALVPMVEGFELNKMTGRLWLLILRLAVLYRQSTNLVRRMVVTETRSLTTLLAQSRLRSKYFHNLKSDFERSAVFGGSFYAVAVHFAVALHHADWISTRRHRRWIPHNLPPASAPPDPPVSGGKKGEGKAKRRRTGSDNEDVDFGGGDSGEDAPEEGRECSATPSSSTTSQPQSQKQKASPPATPPTPTEKSQPSPKSSSSKPSAPAPARAKTDSAPKKIDVAVSDAELIHQVSHLAGQSVKSSKSKKSHSKKTGTIAKPGYSSSDESVISVSSETKYESSLDLDSSASEGSEAHEDEDSELSKLHPESQCPGNSFDGVLDAPAPTIYPVGKLAQRASDVLTPYVAPEFTIVSAQKYWVKLEQSFLPSPVPSDAKIKCTTVGIEKFYKFMNPDHPWREVMDKWHEHACLFDTTDFQLDSHIS
ncbi:hypothetical protein PHMEG_0009998 [Phytophthora megakarya]|uniref:Uncharacterized protein n=1 Tax=Phytophthora megakarya TaxID=4795 RepID=A0A225WH95_9STRA|nr:hypothetical protein PHMEG_0009998 [Phytophthora megakarya]